MPSPASRFRNGRLAGWISIPSTAAANGTVRETFAVGRNDQVVLKHHPEKYDCSLFGLAGGGTYWVFVLDDSDQNYRVRSVHGPFISD